MISHRQRSLPGFFFRNLLFLLIFILSGCQSLWEYASGKGACPTLPSMSEGEIVTYTFTYSDGVTTSHTITKAHDGDEQGEIVYNISDGNTSNYKLKDLCPKGPSLSDEQAFLLLGDVSLVANTEKSFENGLFGTPSSEWIKEGCARISLTVKAGEFSAEKCTYVTEDRSESYSTFSHFNNGESPTPLSGLLKYEEQSGDKNVTVELSEWNEL